MSVAICWDCGQAVKLDDHGKYPVHGDGPENGRRCRTIAKALSEKRLTELFALRAGNTAVADAVDEIVRLRAQIRRLTRRDEVYSLVEVISVLARAGEHLLNDHSCDQHGYEITRSCLVAAKEAIVTLDSEATDA